ncbi:arginase [Allofrancisella inopinata]|uniref:Arginase n=1 Tax=Allofrancisella inopinata TaxID=1085647 RepID=A0AAE6YKD7_9GAMM|nr:arginase [Allofrancisella inopinata]QIV96447.1 arginase [Allofrancisella inopinata]TDT68657.1 arginase [Allofrancisella inopinata]
MKKVEAVGVAIGNAGRRVGCGRAPYVFLNAIKDRRLDSQVINYIGGRTEVKTMAKYFTKVAEVISQKLNEGVFPLALGGDHSCAIATWSGVYDHLKKCGNELGLIWVDAHMDSHRPDTSETGNIHGMPVAHLLGYGYQEFKNILNKQPKLKPENIVFFGIRSYEPAEEEFLNSLGVKIYYQKDLNNQNFEQLFLSEFDRLAKATNGNVGISFDLDGLDPVKMDAVGTPVENGIQPEVFYETLAKLDYSQLICFEVAEYNPMLDKTGLSLEYLEKILRLVEGRIKNLKV